MAALFSLRLFRFLALAGAFIASVSALRADPEEFVETLAAPYLTGPISSNATQFGASATSGAWTWTLTGLESRFSKAMSDGPNLTLTLDPSYAPGLHTLSFTTTVLAGAEVFHFDYSAFTTGGSVSWLTNNVTSALTGTGTFERTFAAGDVVGFQLSVGSGSGSTDSVFISNFSAAAGPAAVPEPATTAAWMAGAAGLLVLKLRRRRAPAQA